MKFDIKRTLYKGKYQFEKHKGLIFTLLSAGFEIAAVVLMAKQAPKAAEILRPANKKIECLKKEMNDTELVLNKEVVPAEHKKQIKKIQRETFVKVAKVYALPVIFTGLSLTFMGGSYKVMKDKQIALGAAYVTVENAFKTYRNRIKEKFGEDVEKDIYDNVKEIKRTRKVENPETGEVTEVEETVKRACESGGWEVWFDETSPLFARNGRVNWETLMRAQQQANITLNVQGYIFLYDIFQLLEIPEGTIPKDLLAASRVIGWVRRDDGTSWVSFGIADPAGYPTEYAKDLFDNVEKSILLKFNPDGNIVSEKLNFAYFTKK